MTDTMPMSIYVSLAARQSTFNIGLLFTCDLLCLKNEAVTLLGELIFAFTGRNKIVSVKDRWSLLENVTSRNLCSGLDLSIYSSMGHLRLKQSHETVLLSLFLSILGSQCV
jgi:hypothetical protein